MTDCRDCEAKLLGATNEAEIKEAVDFILEEIGRQGNKFCEERSVALLRHLRDLRRHEDVVRLARTFVEYGVQTCAVRASLGQALIDIGNMTEAIGVLSALANELGDAPNTNGPPAHLVTAYGSLGRAFKQLYIDARPSPIEPRQHDLDTAVRHYRAGYRLDPAANHWHSVNIAALLAHAARVILPSAPLPRAVAKRLRNILQNIAEPGVETDLWKLASATEANVGLGEVARAIQYAEAFAEHPEVTAFAANSLLRQLLQLWNLREDREPGASLIPLLEATRGRKGDVLEIPSDPEHRVNLQKRFGGGQFQSINWLLKGLERSRCVARLGRNEFEGEATGFFVDGATVGDALKDRCLLFTNAHAVSDDEDIQDKFGAMDPRELVVTFTSVDDKRHFKPVRCVKSYPPADLDITVLELEGVVRSFLGDSSPPIGSISPSEGKRINIIGHPHGGGLAFSIRNNEVKRVETPYFHYLAPTEGGSSGSPIFSESWEIVGVHHGAIADANEGIMFSKVADALK